MRASTMDVWLWGRTLIKARKLLKRYDMCLIISRFWFHDETTSYVNESSAIVSGEQVIAWTGLQFCLLRLCIMGYPTILRRETSCIPNASHWRYHHGDIVVTLGIVVLGGFQCQGRNHTMTQSLWLWWSTWHGLPRTVHFPWTFTQCHEPWQCMVN